MTLEDQAERNGWEALFRSVFERSRSPMALLDGWRRTVVEANAPMAGLLGLAPDDLSGSRVDDVVDLERLRGARLSWESLAEKEEHHGETAVTAADGAPLRLYYAARGTEVEGRRLILLVVSDVVHDDEPPAQAIEGALTPREQEVVGLVALGLTSREIADRLVVSIETVRTHVHNAMGKTGTHTRAQLVAIAMAERLLGDEFAAGW